MTGACSAWCGAVTSEGVRSEVGEDWMKTLLAGGGESSACWSSGGAEAGTPPKAISGCGEEEYYFT